MADDNPSRPRISSHCGGRKRFRRVREDPLTGEISPLPSSPWRGSRVAGRHEGRTGQQLSAPQAFSLPVTRSEAAPAASARHTQQAGGVVGQSPSQRHVIGLPLPSPPAAEFRGQTAGFVVGEAEPERLPAHEDRSRLLVTQPWDRQPGHHTGVTQAAGSQGLPGSLLQLRQALSHPGGAEQLLLPRGSCPELDIPRAVDQPALVTDLRGPQITGVARELRPEIGSQEGATQRWSHLPTVADIKAAASEGRRPSSVKRGRRPKLRSESASATSSGQQTGAVAAQGIVEQLLAGASGAVCSAASGVGASTAESGSMASEGILPQHGSEQPLSEGTSFWQQMRVNMPGMVRAAGRAERVKADAQEEAGEQAQREFELLPWGAGQQQYEWVGGQEAQWPMERHHQRHAEGCYFPLFQLQQRSQLQQQQQMQQQQQWQQVLQPHWHQEQPAEKQQRRLQQVQQRRQQVQQHQPVQYYAEPQQGVRYVAPWLVEAGPGATGSITSPSSFSASSPSNIRGVCPTTEGREAAAAAALASAGGVGGEEGEGSAAAAVLADEWLSSDEQWQQFVRQHMERLQQPVDGGVGGGGGNISVGDSGTEQLLALGLGSGFSSTDCHALQAGSLVGSQLAAEGYLQQAPFVATSEEWTAAPMEGLEAQAAGVWGLSGDKSVHGAARSAETAEGFGWATSSALHPIYEGKPGFGIGAASGSSESTSITGVPSQQPEAMLQHLLRSPRQQLREQQQEQLMQDTQQRWGELQQQQQQQHMLAAQQQRRQPGQQWLQQGMQALGLMDQYQQQEQQQQQQGDQWWLQDHQYELQQQQQQVVEKGMGPFFEGAASLSASAPSRRSTRASLSLGLHPTGSDEEQTALQRRQMFLRSDIHAGTVLGLGQTSCPAPPPAQAPTHMSAEAGARAQDPRWTLTSLRLSGAGLSTVQSSRMNGDLCGSVASTCLALSYLSCNIPTSAFAPLLTYTDVQQQAEFPSLRLELGLWPPSEQLEDRLRIGQHLERGTYI